MRGSAFSARCFPPGLTNWEALAASSFFHTATDDGKLVPTELVEDGLPADLAGGWRVG
jgi:hypothetical protein